MLRDEIMGASAAINSNEVEFRAEGNRGDVGADVEITEQGLEGRCRRLINGKAIDGQWCEIPSA